MMADGQTSMTTIIFTFRNFENALKYVISGTNAVKFAKMETFWQFGKSQTFMQNVGIIF